MEPGKVIIGAFPSTRFEVKLPKQVATGLGVNDGKTFWVRCGQRGQPALARVVKNTDQILLISRALLSGLLLPQGVTLNIRLDKEGAIRLGPAIGVFVNSRYLTRFRRSIVPGSARELERANREKRLDCLAYFFTLSGVDLPRKRVKGYYFGAGGWRYRWLPFPETIYDRGVNFLPNERKRVREFRETVRDAKIPRVNTVDELGKWETYRALLQCPEVAGILPQTVRIRSMGDVRKMLAVYPVVILKGDLGRRGRQVMLVAKEGKSYRITSHKGSVVANSLKEVETFARSFMHQKSFVIQRAVSLLKAGNRSMDFRIFIAKDGSGRWVAVYNLARVAQGDMPITNTALGADEMRALEALRSAGLTTEMARTLDRRARELSIQVGRCLEKSFGSLGELGIDLGIDAEKNIWFFEANAKPDRKMGPRFADWNLLQYVRALQYSMFLAGFPSEE